MNTAQVAVTRPFAPLPGAAPVPAIDPVAAPGKSQEQRGQNAQTRLDNADPERIVKFKQRLSELDTLASDQFLSHKARRALQAYQSPGGEAERQYVSRVLGIDDYA
ncbi:MAG: hypothetical protein WCP34_07935 [Pseudomonadota bacterium]